MNPARRKELARANALIGVASEIVTDCAEQEREARARLPEALADGDRAAAMERAIKALGQASTCMAECAEHITEAMEA